MRAWARWGIAPLLAAPAGAWALGLGDIELKSALNQPFRADIALSATSDELQSLRITLANPDTFERYGLDRPAFLSAFQFRVVANAAGRNVIEVTSQTSVAEPFLTLLVEATWPRGRTLREYTVFLDPPVLLPAPAAPPAVQPAETRTSGGGAGGPIDRPSRATAPAPAPEPAAPPRPVSSPPVSEAAPGPVSNATPPAPAPRAQAVAPGGTYGPVQRGEALWAIADRMRPEGVSVNQMMIAIYQANAAAFGGNINLLRAGATLRIPENADLNALTRTAANAEVQRQTDEWQGRSPGQLRLLPPTETVAREPEPAPAPVSRDTRAADAEVAAAAAAAAAAAEAEESRRLIELRNAELRNIQDQAAAVDEPEVAVAANAEPGVDLDEVFADEEPAPAPVDEEPAVTPAPVPAPTPAVATEPSLVSQAIGWLRSPLLWIGLGVALVLFAALWFVRRRRQETEDVTGRWEALEAETDEDPMTRDATERMRRQLPEETIVVEEQHAQQLRPEPEAPARRAAAPAAAASRAPRAAPAPDETLSSQTVINLDQADAIAEADFHVAYGLYDQAAELVQKAIEAAPERRDLKLKLLEVFFMWGNKDAFLKAAQGLRSEIGQAEDADWDKVVIMGRQICPDERLFTEATTGGGRVDVDLQAGDSPLDLAFDDAAAADVGAAASAGLDFQLDSSDERPAPKPAAKPAKPAKAGRDDMLDIGSKTAAGLEAALFAPMGRDDDEDTGKRTSPDISADSLAVTQESPTIERPGNTDWATLESTALHSSEAPTVETPTIESPAARSATGVTKKLAMPGRGESPTVEQPALGGASAGEYTAEIDLDDLGLDVKDLEGLPGDLGDLPMAAGSDTDTREQKVLRDDDSLLSATGVTKVLHEEEDFTASRTSVMADQDATMLAPGFDEGTSTLTGTEVLEGRLEVNDQSGNTALVRSLKGQKESVDLDLADLTAALQGADTVEQPRTSSFSNDVFGSGSTPLDLDVGSDAAVGDDDPTGTEEASPLDPQTMTEVGTKLDLARAYIDMGDPEGARSILEEVLDEGDSNQRREAQGLIDVLSA